MSYKRLRSRIQSSSDNSFDQIFSAFEAEGKSLQNIFTPTIHHPTSDYAQDIAHIAAVDAKLGMTFNRLNQHQRHAVFHPSPNTILAAMVGSGKTTVLIAKIFFLHFIQHIPFDKMVVLTFTNKAAREIKERIGAFMGQTDEDLGQDLRYFGTFHSVARQLLQDHPKLNDLGFNADFMIMDEEEKQAFLERLIIQDNLNIKYQNKLSKRWRKHHQTGDTMMGNMKSEDDFARLVTLAQQEKRDVNTMDFDDLISHCNTLLAQQNATAAQWVIVDEFQDCNDEQLQMIELLRHDYTQLYVVGDQNQSIYGWRGSKENLFQDIVERWQATWMELPQNYRSTKSILSAAETLLQNTDSTLVATRQSGAPIELVRHFDDQQEAYYLQQRLATMIKEEQALENVAILFRTHQQVGIVETILTQGNIPYQTAQRTKLSDNDMQSFFVHLLKLCVNANDVDACIALICHSVFGTQKKTKTLITALHKRTADTTALAAMVQYLESRKTVAHDFVILLNKIAKSQDFFTTTPLPDLDELIDFFGLNTILKPTSIHHASYRESLAEAWQQMQRYIQAHSFATPHEMLHVAIDQVMLEGTFYINERIKTQGNGVHLLTIHAAKGLEFDHVYIVGANTGIIPHTQHQKGSQNLKEEKRLLFVALTRGKNSVEIGWHAQPTLRGIQAEPSYFLNAIPDAYLKRRTAAEITTPSPDAAPTDEWTTGLAVKHKKYGTGTVLSTTEKEITCTFGSIGEKNFSRAFAKALLTKE